MIKHIFIVIVALFSVSVMAENGQKTSTCIKNSHQINFLKNTGGFLLKPGSQLGEITFLDCQSGISKLLIEDVANYFTRVTKFKISIRDGNFKLNDIKIVGSASIFIIHDKDLPSILVAPESRWAVVNTAMISDKDGVKFYNARVQKELSRAFAFLCGATNSQYPRSLTRGIVKHSDLDKNPDYELPADVIGRFTPYMATLGVTPAIKSTYKKACREGWAPAPTNEYQKAIWDKVHAMPTAPIKIKPETKKVRE